MAAIYGGSQLSHTGPVRVWDEQAVQGVLMGSHFLQGLCWTQDRGLHVSILGPWKTPDYHVADTRVLLPTLLQVRLGLVSLLPLQKAFGEGQQSPWVSSQLSCRGLRG